MNDKNSLFLFLLHILSFPPYIACIRFYFICLFLCSLPFWILKPLLTISFPQGGSIKFHQNDRFINVIRHCGVLSPSLSCSSSGRLWCLQIGFVPAPHTTQSSRCSCSPRWCPSSATLHPGISQNQTPNSPWDVKRTFVI